MAPMTALWKAKAALAKSKAAHAVLVKANAALQKGGPGGVGFPPAPPIMVGAGPWAPPVAPPPGKHGRGAAGRGRGRGGVGAALAAGVAAGGPPAAMHGPPPPGHGMPFVMGPPPPPAAMASPLAPPFAPPGGGRPHVSYGCKCGSDLMMMPLTKGALIQYAATDAITGLPAGTAMAVVEYAYPPDTSGRWVEMIGVGGQPL